MKLFNKTAIAMTLVIGALGMSSAQAFDLNELPAVSSTNLNVTVRDGVATLFGQADSASEHNLVEQYVAKMEGVDSVINLVTY